ncbi:MAG: hypothetical protein ABL929_07050 [Ferruginibacter sp.]
MKTASLKELKQELENTPTEVLLELCIKLTKYKKENKELLTYLLFEEGNENNYVNSIKTIIDELFETINKTQMYFAKKTLRKIVRIANKYIKYSNSKTTEPDVLLHFCKKMKALNIYLSQIKKIKKAIAAMHDDEQYDYLKLLTELE